MENLFRRKSCWTEIEPTYSFFPCFFFPYQEKICFRISDVYLCTFFQFIAAGNKQRALKVYQWLYSPFLLISSSNQQWLRFSSKINMLKSHLVCKIMYTHYYEHQWIRKRRIEKTFPFAFFNIHFNYFSLFFNIF